MDEREFAERAEQMLAHIESVLEGVDQGLDYEVAPGGILEIEFEDGSQVIINRHMAAREIWVAARSGGFHFRWDGADWVDTRSGKSLLSCLGEVLSSQAGVPIIFPGC